MPRFDGTGPQGQGPMTGRGMGSCNKGACPVFGRGNGRGMGRGAGRGFSRFCPWRWFSAQGGSASGGDGQDGSSDQNKSK